MDATCQEKAALIDNGGIEFRDTRRIMNMFYVPFTDVIANIVHPEFMETDEKFVSFLKLEMWVQWQAGMSIRREASK